MPREHERKGSVRLRGPSRPMLYHGDLDREILDALIQASLYRIDDALRFSQRIDADIGSQHFQLDLDVSKTLIQDIDRLGELLLRFLQGFDILDDLQMVGKLLRRLSDLVTP